MAVIDTLRQLRFPQEFRISAPLRGESASALLERVSRLLAERPEPSAKPIPAAQAEPQRLRFLGDVATGVWRLRNRMVHPDTGKPIDEMRHAYRHCESLWDLLANAQVRILDHTGEDFDSGRSLKVLAFEPRPGLRRERIVETIKPTVYVGDDFVQMGEVIVGTPEQGSE